jgi:hypothetical protein
MQGSGRWGGAAEGRSRRRGGGAGEGARGGPPAWPPARPREPQAPAAGERPPAARVPPARPAAAPPAAAHDGTHPRRRRRSTRPGPAARRAAAPRRRAGAAPRRSRRGRGRPARAPAAGPARAAPASACCRGRGHRGPRGGGRPGPGVGRAYGRDALAIALGGSTAMCVVGVAPGPRRPIFSPPWTGTPEGAGGRRLPSMQSVAYGSGTIPTASPTAPSRTRPRAGAARSEGRRDARVWACRVRSGSLSTPEHSRNGAGRVDSSPQPAPPACCGPRGRWRRGRRLAGAAGRH